jgi:cell fate regulator YaaT (PSP1 superfamily)
MCCLKYENDEYEEAKALMPDIGTRIQTPDGPGKVVGLNLLERLMQVSLADHDQVLEYTLDEIVNPKEAKVQMMK